MKLYKFMQDEKWWEDCLHILVGLVPMWGWIRENNQWPPGKPHWVPTHSESNPTYVTQLDRVEDAYRDFLGYAIGGTIRFAIVFGLLMRPL